MATRFSQSWPTERSQPSRPPLRLSSLQQSILFWLYQESSQVAPSPEPSGLPFSQLVRALETDKAHVTQSVCQLLRKGLVLTTRPAGAWVHSVALTEQGRNYVTSLAASTPKHRRKRR